VFWVNGRSVSPAPREARGASNLSSGGAAPDVFVTRLHLRYDAEHFPDDLRFQETADRSNFQGRYVLRQPWGAPGAAPRQHGIGTPSLRGTNARRRRWPR